MKNMLKGALLVGALIYAGTLYTASWKSKAIFQDKIAGIIKDADAALAKGEGGSISGLIADLPKSSVKDQEASLNINLLVLKDAEQKKLLNLQGRLDDLVSKNTKDAALKKAYTDFVTIYLPANPAMNTTFQRNIVANAKTNPESVAYVVRAMQTVPGMPALSGDFKAAAALPKVAAAVATVAAEQNKAVAAALAAAAGPKPSAGPTGPDPKQVAAQTWVTNETAEYTKLATSHPKAAAKHKSDADTALKAAQTIANDAARTPWDITTQQGTFATAMNLTKASHDATVKLEAAKAKLDPKVATGYTNATAQAKLAEAQKAYADANTKVTTANTTATSVADYDINALISAMETRLNEADAAEAGTPPLAWPNNPEGKEATDLVQKAADKALEDLDDLNKTAAAVIKTARDAAQKAYLEAEKSLNNTKDVIAVRTHVNTVIQQLIEAYKAYVADTITKADAAITSAAPGSDTKDAAAKLAEAKAAQISVNAFIFTNLRTQFATELGQLKKHAADAIDAANLVAGLIKAPGADPLAGLKADLAAVQDTVNKAFDRARAAQTKADAAFADARDTQKFNIFQLEPIQGSLNVCNAQVSGLESVKKDADKIDVKVATAAQNIQDIKDIFADIEQYAKNAEIVGNDADTKSKEAKLAWTATKEGKEATDAYKEVKALADNADYKTVTKITDADTTAKAALTAAMKIADLAQISEARDQIKIVKTQLVEALEAAGRFDGKKDGEADGGTTPPTAKNPRPGAKSAVAEYQKVYKERYEQDYEVAYTAKTTASAKVAAAKKEGAQEGNKAGEKAYADAKAPKTKPGDGEIKIAGQGKIPATMTDADEKTAFLEGFKEGFDAGWAKGVADDKAVPKLPEIKTVDLADKDACATVITDIKAGINTITVSDEATLTPWIAKLMPIIKAYHNLLGKKDKDFSAFLRDLIAKLQSKGFAPKKDANFKIINQIDGIQGGMKWKAVA